MSKLSTFAYLQSICPGVITIDSQTLAAVIGVSHHTINNLKDTFPIPCLKFGRKRYYRLQDVAAYIDGALGIAGDDDDESEADASTTAVVPQEIQASPPIVKRGRGRPPKILAGRAARGVREGGAA